MTMYYRMKKAYKQLKRAFKESFTVVHVTADSVDSYDRRQTTTSSTSITGVMITSSDTLADMGFGRMDVGDASFLMDDDVTISKDDQITHNSNTYHVNGVERLRMDDKTVCKAATCRKE